MNAGDSRVIAFTLILGSLVASSLTSARQRRITGGIVVASVLVGIASFAAARAAFTLLEPTAAFVLAVASALVAALLFSRALVVVRAHAEPSLDADALALAPAAAWMGLCSLLTGLGAEATHTHVVVPALARGVAALGSLLAAVAVVTLVRQRAWTARVYRGEAAPLVVSVAPEASPLLSHVEGADAAIVVERGALGSYRQHPSAIARVPANQAVLVGRYTTRLGTAALALVGGLAALAGGARADVAHPSDASALPRLRSFPGVCAASPPKLRFVPLSPLKLVDIEGLAARYRRAGLDVRVDEPLAGVERFRDPQRGQLVAEEIARASLESHAPRGPHEFVIVVTDGDMYVRSMAWRFAFAYAQNQLAVVSLARMNPSFPWAAPQSYAPSRPGCSVDLHARAFKMITRQIVLRACNAPPVDDNRSARRASVLGLADLDAIEEDNY